MKCLLRKLGLGAACLLASAGCKKKETTDAPAAAEGAEFEPFKKLSGEEIAAGRGRIRESVQDHFTNPIHLKVEQAGVVREYRSDDLELAFYGDVNRQDREVESLPLKELAKKLKWSVDPNASLTLVIRNQDALKTTWKQASEMVVDWRLGKDLRTHQAPGAAKGKNPKERKKTQRFIEKIVIGAPS